LKAAEASENSKRQKASSFLVKPGTAPRITPSQFGNGPLKRHHEFIGTGEVCINILLAEHLFPLLETLLKQITIRHGHLLCPTDDGFRQIRPSGPTALGQTEKNSVRVYVFRFEPQTRTLLDAFELRSIEERRTDRNPSGPAWTLVSLRQSAVPAEL
jgi:hypothetical protein